MTRVFERKLGQRNFHKLNHRWNESNDAAAALNTPVHQQILRCALHLMQISESCPLDSRVRPTAFLCPTYLFASRSAEQTRKKWRRSLGAR